jgi:hypothetical protein
MGVSSQQVCLVGLVYALDTPEFRLSYTVAFGHLCY